jgi:pimeloyl-ACP methyl ester carboxylesterase
MSIFVMVPGAGGAAWYWHRVVRELEARGHQAVVVDLPGADESAGLPEYAEAVVAAIGGRRDVAVVGQSLGGFTAPVACARARVRLLVLVNPMIPWPGETPGEWWGNTGWEQARVAAAAAGGYPAEFDLATYFLHDVPADIAADVAFGQPCAIDRWPDVPTRVLSGREDRFFPLEFQRRVARERLAAEVDVVPGGHLAALSHPAELTDRLIGYL